jgi:2-polyprenyl-6-methoxyphenol hydroxylase-like FAD-dependent oxidoreductase
MSVVIVGGGIAGLTTAIAIRQAGIEAAVFDRVDDIASSQIGAGLGLSADAARVLEKLGILDRVLEVGERKEREEFRTWKGKLLAEESFSEGDTHLSVTREALLGVLVDSLGADAIVTGRTCDGFEQNDSSVTATFSDRTTAHGDVLIGADGLYSVIRAQSLGDEPPRYAGFCVMRSVVPVREGDDPLPRRLLRLLWGRGACMGMYHVSAERVYFFGWWRSPEGERIPRGHRKEALLKRYHDWSPEVCDLIERSSEETIFQTPIYDRPPVTSWGEGRVTLSGDAAHPMTFNMGQGACQAMEDAAALAGHLASDGETPAALRSYERERGPRTKKLVRTSAMASRLSVVRNPIAVGVRNFMLSKAAGRGEPRSTVSDRPTTSSS